MANIKKGLERIQQALALYGWFIFSAGMIWLVLIYEHTATIQLSRYMGFALGFLVLSWGPYGLFTVLYWITRGFLDIDDD